jgi:hypothetical protein
MKKPFVLSLSFMILLVACNNNKAKTSAQTQASSDTSQSLPPGENDVIQKRMEVMKSYYPLSAEKVKALFPDSLLELKMTDYKAFNDEGYEVGEAMYGSDDGKELDVTIIDCAGEAGAGKYNIMYVGYLNTESQDDNGYKKSVRFNGDKAIESYDKKQDRYSILFLSRERLLVNVEGTKTGLDIVKQAGVNLNLKTN